MSYLDSSTYQILAGDLLDFRKRKLKTAWRYTAAGVLWRIVPTRLGALIGEARGVERKQASFFCVHRETGRVLWEGESFGEQWWIGIEALQNDTLLLHKFAKPDMPEHRTIIAVDVLTGKELWRNDALKFESVSGDVVVASRRAAIGDEVVTVGLRNGEVVNEANDVAQTDPIELDQHFPKPIFDLSEDSPINLLIRKHCNAESLVGFVECCSLSKFLIFSYHERSSSAREEPKFNTQLKVLNQGEGTILFSETINQNSSAVAPENFFVESGTLFFISERTTLCALALGE